MSEPFLGEIRLFANGYAPRGWAKCEGQILSIAQNTALFSLLGTTYGGNGQTTFALPDLRGRVPVHFGPSIPLGSAQGEAAHTLTSNEMPMHNHLAQGSSADATDISPQNNVWAAQTNLYGPASSLAAMNAESITSAGGSQPHDNMQPYLSVHFCIALQGIFPSRN